ncbi:MAG: hypothetical protein ONB05_09785 [candidate division KSB1 bacterium]|nr:hypothetical protein [candidate division KSB1 bacterium]
MLENAVKHGIASSRSGGTIELTLKSINSRMRGTVVNRSKDELSTNISATISNGTGITNIRQRLDRLYGDTYSWQIDCSEANTFKVTFEIP